jgi:hypothetical protein
MAKVTTRQPLQRRLNLVDLCVLVVATAVGLVAIRQDLVGLLSWPQDWKTGQAVQLWTDPIALSKAVTVEIWLARSHGLGGDGLVSNRGGGACRVGITRSERALSHSS